MIAPLRSEIRLGDIIRSLFRYKGYGARLESDLIEYFGVRNVLLTHSGRTGLYFLLKALPHKKVYLPAYNCWAVTEAALYAKKEIEYADISLDDYNMDVAKLRDTVVADSIILATHQFGIPCNIEAIMELARERNCLVIEDNAPALGSEIGGKRTGSFGAASIISFDYSKAVVSGKGGAILFNDEELYRTVKVMHDQATVPTGAIKSLRYMLVALAYSYATCKWLYPLTYALFRRTRGCSLSSPAYDLTKQNESYRLACDERRAKLACLGMKRLESVVGKRKKITDFYLRECDGNRNIVPPEIPDGAEAALLKFPIRLQGFDREYFYTGCIEKGIDLAFLFPFHYSSDHDGCPNARIAAQQAMSLPVYEALSAMDLKKIMNVLNDKSHFVFGPDTQSCSELVEKRKLLCFTLHYYWMDTAAFLKSTNFISLLRTHEELPENEYNLKIAYKTVLIDLSRTKKELYSAFDSKGASYPIRKAVKCGVSVKRAETAAEKEAFYSFYQAFVAEPKRKDKILALQDDELGRLLIFNAVSGVGEYLGGIGLLPSPDGRYLLYKYSATRHRFCENDLMIWHALQYAKDAGFKWFDMSWFLPTEHKDSDQYRLYQFKKKFGGEQVDFYSYVKFRGPFLIPVILFKLILRFLFRGDIDRFALCLKALKIFK